MRKVYYIFSFVMAMLLADGLCIGQSRQDSTEWRFNIDSAVIKDHFLHKLRGNLYIANPVETGRFLSVTGENDVLKIMESKPGVSIGIEGTNAYYVRGSGSSSAKIELNGFSLTRSSHLLGMVSSVPSEMVKNITFLPGGQSSSSGNYTSALINIDLKDGLVKEKKEIISASPYIGSYYLEAPVSKTLTTRISVRGSIAPILANSLLRLFKIGKNKAKTGGGAYDIIASADWQTTGNFKMNGVIYRTQDIFNYGFGSNKTWFNSNETIAKLGGILQLGERFSISPDVGVSMSDELHKEEYIRKTESNSYVRTGELSLKDKTLEYNGKIKVNYQVDNNLDVKIGAELSRRTFKFSSHKKDFNIERTNWIGTYTNYNLFSLYGDINYDVENKIKVKGGLRWNSYSNQIGENAQSLDVHILADYYIKKDFGIELTFDKNSQFYHTLEGLPSGWGQNVVLAASETLPYEKTHQLYAGVFGKSQFAEKSYVYFSAGLFSKRMNDLASYVQSSHVFGVVDNFSSDDIVSGRGKARGLETMVEIVTPKLIIDGSYTYSSASRNFPGINWGKDFRFRFERPHVFNLNASYEIGKKKTNKGYTLTQKVNFAAVVTSGHLMTISKGRYQSILPGSQSIFILFMIFEPGFTGTFFEHDESENVVSHEDLNELNNFRLPMYFRTDAGFSCSWEKNGKGYDLFLSVVNLLNRQNPYQYFYEDGKWKQLSILPIMPTARFVWRF